MIGMLTGTIALRSDPAIIVDVHGVGYKVLVPHTVLSKLTDDQITLFVHTHVREEVLELYGFTTPEDLRLFEHLISVSGVGCKTALGVFTVGSRHDVVKAIISSDVTFFTAVPRLGKKNAQKLIIELKNKLGSTVDGNILQSFDDNLDEVVIALKGFGFSPAEAVAAVRATEKEGASTSERIRLALKYLGK